MAPQRVAQRDIVHRRVVQGLRMEIG